MINFIIDQPVPWQRMARERTVSQGKQWKIKDHESKFKTISKKSKINLQVTFCDAEVREMGGQVHTWTVQCVLMVRSLWWTGRSFRVRKRIFIFEILFNEIAKRYYLAIKPSEFECSVKHTCLDLQTIEKSRRSRDQRSGLGEHVQREDFLLHLVVAHRHFRPDRWEIKDQRSNRFCCSPFLRFSSFRTLSCLYDQWKSVQNEATAVCISSSSYDW